MDEIALIVDCEHKTAPLVDNSVFYSVRTSNIANGKIDYESCNRVSEETYREWTKREIPFFGDLILAREAPVGEVGIVKPGYHVCLGQRTVLIRVNNPAVHNIYLLYYLVNPVNKNALIEMSGGSVVSHLNMKDIRACFVKIPSLAEQTAIASVLSSLDDKIDLLHRQNATLEKMAETLFRQWFVEEAKEEWEVGNVLDLFKLQRGYDLPSQNREDGNVPIITSSGPNGFHIESKVKGPGVTTGRSGVIGKVFFVEEDFWPLNTSLFVLEFKRATPLYTYFFLKTLDLASLNGGSAVPTLNRNDVHALETELPPVDLIKSFEEFVQPYFKKIKSNQTQIRTLTTLRDTLLPKLMSGEVSVIP